MTSPFMILHSMSRDPADTKSIKISPETRRRVWGFAKPYKKMIAGFVGVLIISSALAVLPVLLFRRIIDTTIPNEALGELNWIGLALVGAALLAAGLGLFERYWSSTVGEGLIYDLRVALFDHVQRMPIGFFTQTQTGALISRLNNDVIGAQRAFTGTLGSVVGNVIALLTTLIAMFGLEWRLTLLALLLLPLFIFPARWVGAKLRGITREAMDLNASMNNTMSEKFNVSGAMLVKLFGSPDHEEADFAGRAARVRDIGIRNAMLSRVFIAALSLVGTLGTVLIYWLGGRYAINESITPGTLVALSLLVAQLYGPLTSLSTSRVDIMTAFVSFERVFEVLDTPNPIQDQPDAKRLTDVQGAIQFDHVDFSYPADSGDLGSLAPDAVAHDETQVLFDIDLSIEPGETIAVVGPSGAGKSTLLSLLPRLYDVTTGALRVDGIDIREVTQDSLRAVIGVVNQDPHLFHDTVAANLEYAMPHATRAQLVEACKAAQIHEMIAALPDGYDTIVGERGYRMSGGEKQRLAIARMLLKDPAIVILDEATSHLDTENEHLVQQALAHALEGRTALVIAHRLSTITDADRIVVINNGRVVETGTHDQLRADGGLYNELYDGLLRGNTSAV